MDNSNKSQQPGGAKSAALNKWQKNVEAKCLADRNKVFVANELLADVHFIVGTERVRVPAHKYILAITSFVFYNSFYEQHLTEIHLADVTPEEFDCFLKYVYADEFTADRNNVFAILKLATRFEIDHLESLCTTFIETRMLTTENVLQILQQGNETKSVALRDKCDHIIEWTISDVLKTEAFRSAPIETLQHILNMPKLNCREFELYQGVVEWVERQHHTATKAKSEGSELAPKTDQQRSKREFLGECLFKIRFPTMTPEEFSECAANEELLKPDEISAIFLRIMKKTEDNLLLFSDENRENKVGFHVSGIWIFNRFIKWFQDNATSGSQDVLHKHSALISSSKPVLVVGFGFLLDRKTPNLDDISIQFNGRTDRLVDKKADLMYRLDLNNNLDIVRVLLDKPVLLETDTPYLIQLMNPVDGLMNVSGDVRESVSTDDVCITFIQPKRSPYINSVAEVFIHKTT